MAGKNRGNAISSLIQAFQSGQVQKAYNASLNSEGSAMEEQERWLDSLEAKIGSFKASFQELSNTVIDSSFLKGIVDTGTTAINVINLLTESFGSLNTIIGVVGGLFTTKSGLGKNVMPISIR